MRWGWVNKREKPESSYGRCRVYYRPEIYSLLPVLNLIQIAKVSQAWWLGPQKQHCATQNFILFPKFDSRMCIS